MGKKVTVVELFAGSGGLALGFENAGLTTKCLIEIDKDCAETLHKNRPKWNIINSDIKLVDFSKVKADVVSGGFPCQSFSYAGKKLGFDDVRGTLFFEFARAVKEIQPKMFIGENVAALEKHDDGKTLRTMISVMEDMGYSVKYEILNATHYGVAQKRKRIFIVGTKKGINFEFPSRKTKTITLREALKDVPASDGYEFTARRKEILANVPAGGSWVDLPIELQKEYMGKSFYSGGGKRGMARRISWNEPCLTLTTSPHQKQTDRIHPDETRPFTVREYARIQTFPDSWSFHGGVNSQYRQIGNAVPVKLAEHVGKQVVKAITGN